MNTNDPFIVGINSFLLARKHTSKHVSLSNGDRIISQIDKDTILAVSTENHNQTVDISIIRFGKVFFTKMNNPNITEVLCNIGMKLCR